MECGGKHFTEQGRKEGSGARKVLTMVEGGEGQERRD